MAPKTLKTGLLFLGILGLVGLALNSCTREPSVPEGRLYTIQPDEISHLSIANLDPVKGSHWTAEMKRTPQSQNDWTITSGPQGLSLLDGAADEKFILHLLDTLSTLTTGTSESLKGTLAGFGLEPPHYVLKWTTFKGDTHQLELGAFVSQNTSTMRFARLENKAITSVQGATIEMLNHMSSFDALRKRRLSTMTTDDVDEFEIWNGKNKRLYAQRHGEDWVDAKSKRIPYNIHDFLEGITHLRVKAFLDDQTESAKLHEWIEKKSTQRFVLKDRKGNASILKVAPKDGRLWALFSTRGKQVYELFPEATHVLNTPYSSVR
ncbi:DUF4340 domain-containing protein [bacterium]|jgi:hypothetical protein|nr:DUF4340 domain-containing protein [bacterium]